MWSRKWQLANAELLSLEVAPHPGIECGDSVLVGIITSDGLTLYNIDVIQTGIDIQIANNAISCSGTINGVIHVA